MIIIKTKLYKVIKNIKSLIEEMKIINDRFGGQIWWRGNTDYRYKLQPSVFRKRKDILPPYNETQMNLRFMQKAPAIYKNVPKNDEYFKWLFLMQHYKFATRLLDWTESPLIACYFAVLDEEKTKKIDGALFGMSPYLLNNSQNKSIGKNLLNPGNLTAKKLAECAFGDNISNNNDVLAILPSLIDKRMIAQLSTFTIHNSSMPLEEQIDSDKYLLKYVIPYPSKEILREELKHAGLRPSTIFPDLEHLSEEIMSIARFIDN